MASRKIKFENNEYYHICNRGVDKRKIFNDHNDLWRFVIGVLIFNRIEISNGLRSNLNIYRSKAPVNIDYAELSRLSGNLVEIIAVCLNPNHYHLLVKQVSDNGISKFMQKLGTGYTNYFNEKNKRSGSLFQGKFKAVHVENNEQLLYTSAYVGLNNRVHNISEDDKELVFSSWNEYCGKNEKLNICKGKSIILDQFSRFKDYEEFAKSVAESARSIKDEKRNNYLE